MSGQQERREDEDFEVVYEYHRPPLFSVRLWREAVIELTASRELIWRLLHRDFSGKFRQSVLGYGWAVLPALSAAFVAVKLRSANVLNISETPVPYAVYVLFGMTYWQLFAGGVTAIANCLTGSANLLSKVRFPREALAIAALGNVTFDTALRILLVTASCTYFGVSQHWTVVLVPLAVAPMLLLMVGVGLVFAVGNALIRDVGRMLPLLLAVLVFTVPVFYPPPTSYPERLWLELNPLANALSVAQQLAWEGQVTSCWQGFGWSWLVGAVVFSVGWRFFHLAQSLVAERV